MLKQVRQGYNAIQLSFIYSKVQWRKLLNKKVVKNHTAWHECQQCQQVNNAITYSHPSFQPPFPHDHSSHPHMIPTHYTRFTPAQHSESCGWNKKGQPPPVGPTWRLRKEAWWELPGALPIGHKYQPPELWWLLSMSASIGYKSLKYRVQRVKVTSVIF